MKSKELHNHAQLTFRAMIILTQEGPVKGLETKQPPFRSNTVMVIFFGPGQTINTIQFYQNICVLMRQRRLNLIY